MNVAAAHYASFQLEAATSLPPSLSPQLFSIHVVIAVLKYYYYYYYYYYYHHHSKETAIPICKPSPFVVTLHVDPSHFHAHK